MPEVKGVGDMAKDEPEQRRGVNRPPAWKALAFALGVGVSGCAPESRPQEKQVHHHAITHEALSKTFSPSFTELRVIDEDKDFIYFQVSRLRFIKVENSQANGKWLDQLFLNWKHALERAKTKEEKDRANEFYKEKIEYELKQMRGTLVE